MQNLTRKVVQTCRATLMKACCNPIPYQASLTKPVSVSASDHKSPIWNTDAASGHQSPWNMDAASGHQSPWKTFGNPCFDMFHYLFPWINSCPFDYNHHYDNRDYHLKRLLPHAWSYCPLTTLKIIRHLHHSSGPNGSPMSEALYWIHHNHPKTLAANLIPLLLQYGVCSYGVLTDILHRILDLKHVPIPGQRQDHVNEINQAIKAGTTKAIPEPLRILSNRVVYMYEKDPNFRFLHDQVSHLFAQGLKFDIQNLLEKLRDYDCSKDQPLEVTETAEHCEGSPFLLESVARRVFPQVANVEEAVDMLSNEVLAPLKKVLCPNNSGVPGINIYGYANVHNKSHPFRYQRRPVLDLYLKELSESPDKMVADALLPHELVEYVIGKNDGDVPRHAVERQWKAMVEDLKKKQLRVLNSSLAVINDISGRNLELTGAMTILISELSKQEAWKGKVISMTPDPQLLLIQGHDLYSKCEFLQDPTNKMLLSSASQPFDCKKVLHLILQQAVTGSLKQEQMIKKVFVFSYRDEFEDLCGWEVQDYDEMRNKYREHGYDIPQIVFWRPDDHLHTPFTDSPDKRGVAAISGFGRAKDRGSSGGVNYIRMFLENDGVVSPQHVMESVLSDQDYRYSPQFLVLD